MISKTWYSITFRNFSCEYFNSLKLQKKKITRFRELLAKILLELSEKTIKPCQNFQRNQHNIVIRKNTSE